MDFWKPNLYGQAVCFSFLEAHEVTMTACANHLITRGPEPQLLKTWRHRPIQNLPYRLLRLHRLLLHSWIAGPSNMLLIFYVSLKTTFGVALISLNETYGVEGIAKHGRMENLTSTASPLALHHRDHIPAEPGQPDR